MVKRVGANSRKKNASRRVARKHMVRKVIVRSFFTILAGSCAATLIYFGYDGIMGLKKKFESSSFLSVKNIQVDGAVNISNQNLLALSGLQAGMKIYKVNKKKIDTLLCHNPWIESVKLVKNISGIVKLEIVERKPVALINMGTVKQIDMHGVILPMKDGITSDLPLVSGLTDTVDSWGRKVIRPECMKRLSEFFKQTKLVDKELLANISQIELSDKEKIRMIFKSCPTLFELDAGSVALRLGHLKQLENMLVGMDQVPSRINLCYQNLAFVTQPVVVEKEVIQAVSD